MKVSSAEVIDDAARLIQNQEYSGARKLLRSIPLFELVGRDFVQYCIEYTHAAIYTGDYDCSHIDAAIDLLRSEDTSNLLARAKMLKGLAFVRQGRFDTAVQHYLEASVLYRNAGNAEFTAICLNLLSWTHSRLGNYSAAANNYGEALQVIQVLRVASGEERLRKKERDIAHNLANLNIQFGRLKEGVEIYSAYPLSRQELSSSTAINFHINVAQAYVRSNRIDEARDALESCKPHLKGQIQEEALYFNGLGLIFFNECNVGQALGCYEKAIALIQRNDSDLLAGLYRWQAECQLALGQQEKAATSVQKSFDRALESREQVEMGCCHSILGRIATHQDHLESARNHFTQAITILERINSQYELARTRHYAACSGVFPFERCRDLLRVANIYFDQEQIPRMSKNHTEEILVHIGVHQSCESQRSRIAEILRS